MGIALWVFAYLAIVLVSYYLASFVQASLHYLLGHHPRGGFLYQTHMFDHHARYPGDAPVSEKYSEDEGDVSVYYLVPACALAAGAYLLLPTPILIVHVLSLGLSYGAHVYLHVQYHQKGAWLNRFRWFQRKRHLHLVHHQEPSRNFAVIEFFWDRLWGTYLGASG